MVTHQWEVGKEYKLRNGDTAEILDVNYRGNRGKNILGKIKRHNEEVITWESEGSFAGEKYKHRYDLMPPIKTKELWVNVYNGYGGIWSEKEIADYNAASDRIGLVKITITGDEFEVEKVAI